MITFMLEFYILCCVASYFGFCVENSTVHSLPLAPSLKTITPRIFLSPINADINNNIQRKNPLECLLYGMEQTWHTSVQRIRDNPIKYLSIPIAAAFVGYITNYLGVWMLFYPIEWSGVTIKRWQNQPFGILGWQGVVPAKRNKMASTMVDVTISRLLKVSEVFLKLDPKIMAGILTNTVKDAVFGGLVPLPVLRHFLESVAKDTIKRIETLVDVKKLVVSGLTTNPKTLGAFFQKVAARELSFLVTSGAYFGFLLGIVQMVQLSIFPNNWTLPIGGAVVGYATNWIALKWIFEPTYPTRFGPFVLQGLFLQRQKEVSEQFSTYISANILTSQEIWKEILSSPSEKLFGDIIVRNVPFLSGNQVRALVERLQIALTNNYQGAAGLKELTNRSLLQAVKLTGAQLHAYSNQALGLRALLIERMSTLTPKEFEQVLRPIFQEDEIILIVAGGVLGFAAGAVQWWINSEIEKRTSTSTVSS